MTPVDFIYDQTYKGAIAKGAAERFAKDAAIMALDDFKKNKHARRPSELIDKQIKVAIKRTKVGS